MFFLWESSSFITYLHTQKLDRGSVSFVSHLNNIVMHKEVPLVAERATIKSKHCRGATLELQCVDLIA